MLRSTGAACDGAKTGGPVFTGGWTLIFFLFFLGRLDEVTAACCMGTLKVGVVGAEGADGEIACPPEAAEPPGPGGAAKRPNPARRS